VLVDLVVEEGFRQLQRQGEDAHQRLRKLAHCSEVLAIGLLEASDAGGPDVRREMRAGCGATVVVLIRYIARPDGKGFLEITGRGLLHRIRQALFGDGAVAAHHFRAGPVDLALFRQWQGEELPRQPRHALDQFGGDLVISDDQKADVATGLVHGLGYLGLALRRTGEIRRQVDDRNVLQSHG